METSKKRSVVSSIMNMKCPKCREGELFDKGMFDKPFDMPDRCSVCNQNYMPEPGFYFGAMFISYIFYGWFCLGLTLPLVLFFDWSIYSAFALLLFISALLFVWIFRVSRSIWIHIAVNYQPNVLEKEK